MVQSVSLPDANLIGAKANLKKGQVVYSYKFNWVMTALAGWLTLGVILDSLAHVNGLPDTFFTPWHGVLYTGGLSLVTVLATVVIGNRYKGYTWRNAIPRGYELAVFGAVLFLIAGVFDMTWHLAFGIERKLEASLSPSHLLLVTAMTLIVSGPFGKAWKSVAKAGQGLNFWLPTLIGLVFILFPSNLILSFYNPYFRSYAAQNYFVEGEIGLTLGVTAVMFYYLVFTTVLLLLVRQWTLPVGFLTAFIFANIGLASIALQAYVAIPAFVMFGLALMSGLTVEILYQWLKPTKNRLEAVRWFAFAAPFALVAWYFLAVAIFGGGIRWTVHIWTGLIVLAGFAGWLLSFIAFPPPSTVSEESPAE
jgi:hypothetical protein